MFAMKQCERKNVHTTKIHVAIIAFPRILVGILVVVCFVDVFSSSPKTRFTVCATVSPAPSPRVQCRVPHTFSMYGH